MNGRNRYCSEPCRFASRPEVLFILRCWSHSTSWLISLETRARITRLRHSTNAHSRLGKRLRIKSIVRWRKPCTVWHGSERCNCDPPRHSHSISELWRFANGFWGHSIPRRARLVSACRLCSWHWARQRKRQCERERNRIMQGRRASTERQSSHELMGVICLLLEVSTSKMERLLAEVSMKQQKASCSLSLMQLSTLALLP